MKNQVVTVQAFFEFTAWINITVSVYHCHQEALHLHAIIILLLKGYALMPGFVIAVNMQFMSHYYSHKVPSPQIIHWRK